MIGTSFVTDQDLRYRRQCTSRSSHLVTQEATNSSMNSRCTRAIRPPTRSSSADWPLVFHFALVLRANRGQYQMRSDGTDLSVDTSNRGSNSVVRGHVRKTHHATDSFQKANCIICTFGMSKSRSRFQRISKLLVRTSSDPCSKRGA